MGTIYKQKNNKYRAQVKKNDFNKSKVFYYKRDAVKWLSETTKEYEKIKQGFDPSITFYEATERYINEISIKHKGFRKEILRLKALQKEDFAKKTLLTITTDEIQKWINKRSNEKSKRYKNQKISSDTVLKELCLISSVFDVSIKVWQYCDENPTKNAIKPKKGKPRERRITEEETKKILIALDYDDDNEIKTIRHYTAIAFLLAIETAMRQGEIWKLKKEDIFLNERYLILYDTKNSDNRKVPLSKKAINLIEKIYNNNSSLLIPYNQNSCGQIFIRALKIANIKDLRFHDTRHEAISRLSKVFDVLELSKISGIRDPRILMIYYNPTIEELASKFKFSQAN